MPTQDFDPKIKGIIARTIERAVNHVGTLTILTAIGAFGLLVSLTNFNLALWISIGYFGFAGACEVFHLQRKSELKIRLEKGNQADSLFEQMLSTTRFGQPKVIEQINYGGFCFNGIGFDKLPTPIGISQPLCPKCKRVLVETAFVQFPGRVRITVACICGFEQHSKWTKNELRMQASQALNVPR